MKRFQPRVRLFAAGLSALAGYVDALGFLALGGFFVSFMSGNSTRLAVGLAERGPSAVVSGALIGAFLLGVLLGSVVGRLSGRWRRLAVICFVTVLLAVAGAMQGWRATMATPLVMALAMGAENAVFEEAGDVRIGLTYMTGALVRVGQGLAGAFFGGDPFTFAPYLLLWGGLLAGAVTGGLVYGVIGLSGLWFAVGAGALLAAIAARAVLRDQ